jgi:hypothetical protein
MSLLTQFVDFVPGQVIQSQQVDDSFLQLTDTFSGERSDIDILLKYTHATDAGLRVDQLSTGKILSLLQNGSEKARIDNDGSAVIAGLSASLSHASNPVINANQTGAGLIQRWQQGGNDKAKINNDGSMQSLVSGSAYYRHGGSYDFNATSTPNSGTGETTLYTKTLEANFFEAVGSRLDFEFYILSSATGNNKRTRIYVASTVVYDVQSTSFPNNYFVIKGSIVRVDATTVRLGGYSLMNTVAHVANVTSNASSNTATSLTFSSTITLSVTGQGGASNDLTFGMGTLTKFPAP